ncbi:hypothetical protein PEPNEM18_00338 [Aedoeadaptatus nemausensis]|uniref:Small ribosomal subunit protein bS16 n=1 Tax=Aedoeadaptatus nemausensis TaxID=2582829 RepID=A0A6V6XZX8_9FIRM|nr:hypothetical protein PEPNEM18_00338 [Peptoniphilus nemausensis]
MAVKIRLKRMGSKKSPFYRIVVAESRKPRDGRFIEEIGYYNPLTEPKILRVDADKANNWIKNGAKPTTTVDRLFKENAVYEATGNYDNTDVQKAKREEEKAQAAKARAEREAELDRLEEEEKERKAKEAEAAKAKAEAEAAAAAEEEAAEEADEEAEETEEAEAEEATEEA